MREPPGPRLAATRWCSRRRRFSSSTIVSPPLPPPPANAHWYSVSHAQAAPPRPLAASCLAPDPRGLERLVLRGHLLLFKEETRPPGGRGSGGNRPCVCVVCVCVCVYTHVSTCTRVPGHARLSLPLKGALGTQILEYCQKECPKPKPPPKVAEVLFS